MSTHVPKRRQRISVAMIVRDAEQAVVSSLESVQDIADEIVVVDTGSSDGTVSAASPLATRIREVAWQDDFSAARNACLAVTKGDWILWLDAGEVLEEETAQQLRSYVNESADAGTVYRLQIQRPPANGALSGMRIAQHRLMPAKSELRFQGRVAESLDDAIARLDLQSEMLDLVICRPPSDHGNDVRLEKARRNLRIVEQELAETPDDLRSLLVQAESLAELGEHAEARRLFQQVRQNAKQGSGHMLASFYGELTSYDGDVDHHETQLTLCLKAIETFPVDMQLLCALGNYLQTQQRTDLAVRAYQTAVQFGQLHYAYWHLTDIADIVVTCLSASLELQDQHEEAQAVLSDALSKRPGSSRIRYQLIDLHIRHGRRKEAVEQVSRLPATWPHRESFANAVRGACLANQQNWVAAAGYLESAYQGGCRDAVCLRWLCFAFMALNRMEDAQSVFDQWCLTDPGNPETEKIEAGIRAGKFDPSGISPATARQFQLHESSGPPRPKSTGKVPTKKTR